MTSVVILRSVCSKCQNGLYLHRFIIFPFPFYSKVLFYPLLYTLCRQFSYVVEEDKGYKHIHKSNNYSLCFRSNRSALPNLHSGFLSDTQSRMQDCIRGVCHRIVLRYKLRIINILLIASIINIQSKGSNSTKLIFFAVLYK